ncbi:MAG: hypothetical protein MI919_03345 [Holophagales bacterium]|nr:hypothetical protein [Holophagales bacterium]
MAGRNHRTLAFLAVIATLALIPQTASAISCEGATLHMFYFQDLYVESAVEYHETYDTYFNPNLYPIGGSEAQQDEWARVEEFRQDFLDWTDTALEACDSPTPLP